MVSQTVSVALPLWKQVLSGTTIGLGCNNIFGTDPPKAYGSGNNAYGYPGFIYDATGRFVYISLTKKLRRVFAPPNNNAACETEGRKRAFIPQFTSAAAHLPRLVS